MCTSGKLQPVTNLCCRHSAEAFKSKPLPREGDVALVLMTALVGVGALMTCVGDLLMTQSNSAESSCNYLLLVH